MDIYQTLMWHRIGFKLRSIELVNGMTLELTIAEFVRYADYMIQIVRVVYR